MRIQNCRQELNVKQRIQYKNLEIFGKTKRRIGRKNPKIGRILKRYGLAKRFDSALPTFLRGRWNRDSDVLWARLPAEWRARRCRTSSVVAQCRFSVRRSRNGKKKSWPHSVAAPNRIRSNGVDLIGPYWRYSRTASTAVLSNDRDKWHSDVLSHSWRT